MGLLLSIVRHGHVLFRQNVFRIRFSLSVSAQPLRITLRVSANNFLILRIQNAEQFKTGKLIFPHFLDKDVSEI